MRGNEAWDITVHPHGPWTRTVFTGHKNQQPLTRAVNTGVKFSHPCARAVFTTRAVHTGREHCP